jgi:MFS family permease
MTTAWGRIWLLYAIGVLSAGQLGIVPPLVPALQAELDLSLATAGLAVSIVTLVGAVFGLPAGRWCQTIGHARALAIGLTIMALATLLCAIADNAAILLVARGLAGIGYLLAAIAAPSLMAIDAEPRHHAFALSLWSTFVPTGIALATLAAAGFIDSISWRTLFAIDAALLAVALVVTLLGLPRARPHPPVGPSELPGTLRIATPLATAFFCFALLFLALAGLLPAYLVDNRGLAPADAGQIAAVATAFAIAGSLAAAWILHRGVAPGRLVALGMIVSTAIAALAFSAPVRLGIAAFAVSFAVGGLVPAAVFASVPRIAPDSRAIGPINGLLAQAGSLGSLAGPPLLGLWIGWTSWPLAPALLLAVAVVGAVCARATGRI